MYRFIKIGEAGQALNYENKFALLWGEAQLCLPYVYLQNEKKSNDPI